MDVSDFVFKYKGNILRQLFRASTFDADDGRQCRNLSCQAGGMGDLYDIFHILISARSFLSNASEAAGPYENTFALQLRGNIASLKLLFGLRTAHLPACAMVGGGKGLGSTLFATSENMGACSHTAPYDHGLACHGEWRRQSGSSRAEGACRAFAMDEKSHFPVTNHVALFFAGIVGDIIQ